MSVSAEFKKDYQYYQRVLADQQESHDDFCEVYGQVRQDLAHAAATAREARRVAVRHAPSWATQVERFRFDRAVKAYSEALG